MCALCSTTIHVKAVHRRHRGSLFKLASGVLCGVRVSPQSPTRTTTFSLTDDRQESADKRRPFILLSKLCNLRHTIAHPPLGARGAERVVRPRICSNNNLTLLSSNLSQLPSQLATSSFRPQPPHETGINLCHGKHGTCARTTQPANYRVKA